MGDYDLGPSDQAAEHYRMTPAPNSKETPPPASAGKPAARVFPPPKASPKAPATSTAAADAAASSPGVQDLTADPAQTSNPASAASALKSATSSTLAPAAAGLTGAASAQPPASPVTVIIESAPYASATTVGAGTMSAGTVGAATISSAPPRSPFAPKPTGSTAGSESARAETVVLDASLVDPFRGIDGPRRIEAVRRALAAAVVTWWTDSELPSSGLLRDGLLVLEAGHPLDEAQRTLLARTALVSGHGMLTAFRHLGDPERMASLLHEGTLNGSTSPDQLERLRAEGLYGGRWIPFLVDELRADLTSTETPQTARVRGALAVLTGDPILAPADTATRTIDDESQGWPWLRAVAGGILVIALAALILTRIDFAGYGDVIAAPGGTFELTDENGNPFEATLAPFVIARTEVTNAQYRECFDAGKCPWPTSNASAASDDYFVNPAYANYPVINTTWQAAADYCAWREMRLPTMGEWEAAARFAPATQRNYTWPWGDYFEPAFVIAGADRRQPAAVGSRSPQGDSPLGAADMAGNVAEWTGSTVSNSPGLAWVKGGSYRDSPDLMRGQSLVAQDKSESTQWLGFRCAAATQ